MITSKDFPRLTYIKPKLKDSRKSMTKIFGIDSEAYDTGEPFMFCTSENDTIHPKDFPYILFTEKYVNGNFMVYNLKYDSGAFLRHLPRKQLYQLWKENETRHDDTKYKYIPHKMLSLQRGKNYIFFWDISQFYKMTLDKAAQTYIDKSKIDIETKSFSKEYVKANFQKIAEYCIKDAIITKKLGEYLIKKLLTFNIKVSKLYSCASISFKYFCENTNVITVWKYWKWRPNLLKFACDAYEGGKFEVTQRGTFENAIEYDITSAYPYEIKNLIDISHSKVRRTKEYLSNADYGFLRCEISNPDGKYLPCGIMKKDVLRIYPAGKYYLTITKQEYDYLNEINVPVKILDGFWLITRFKRYPYRKIINDLFKIKSNHKYTDKMVYNVSKIIMNSFYGKTAQCIEDNITKEIRAGFGWNPIYASVITANTRIKVARIQNIMKNNCMAVHTDSVMVKKPIPKKFIKDELGFFEFVTQGKLILIACGMYQINDEINDKILCAYKGFKPKIIDKEKSTKDTWENILSNNPTKKKIAYNQLKVESWCEAMARNHTKAHINVFNYQDDKNIDLNCDKKRIWGRRVKAEDLLNSNEKSLPQIIVQSKRPKHFSKKFKPKKFELPKT